MAEGVVQAMNWRVVGRNKDEGQGINRLLDRMTHLAISPLIEDLTIQFRHQHRVKLPDAIIAATASAHGIKLLTLDKKLAVKL